MAKKSKVQKKTQSQNILSFSENKNLYYALIVLILIAILNWTMKTGARKNSLPQTGEPQTMNDYPAIVDNDDLNKAAADLDKEDLSAMDKEMSSLDSDSSTF